MRLEEFPASVEGVIQSFRARYPALDEVLFFFFFHKACMVFAKLRSPRFVVDLSTKQRQELLTLWRQDKEAMAPRPVADAGDAKRRKGENGDGGGNDGA